MEDEVVKALASNGPWAMVAGWLLWTVIKAWDRDRSQLISLLTEFRATLESLRATVDGLKATVDGLRSELRVSNHDSKP